METYWQKMGKELKTREFWRDILAEMVATSLLVSIQAAVPLKWGAETINSLQIALCMGFVVSALIETFGAMGGAQMNPAVSVSMVIAGKLSLIKGVLYIISQCIGAIGGAAFVYGMTPSHRRDGLATTTVNDEITQWQGVAVEGWLTGILVFTIWGSINADRRDVYMPSVPIGMAVALDIMAGINYTGSSMNPARSLGPALVMGIWKDHWVYWLGPILGGIIATLVYHFGLDKITPAKKFDNDIEKEYKKVINVISNVCEDRCTTTCKGDEGVPRVTSM